MNILRTFVFWTGTTFYTIICSFLIMLAGYLDKGRKVTTRLCRAYGRGLLFLADTGVSIEGGENVNLFEPRIYVSNHRSYFDVIALLAYLPGESRFVAKKSLLYIPFFGQAMTAIGSIVIDRSDPDKARRVLMNEGGKRLSGAFGIVVFPEGTRSRDGEMLPFKTGAFRLALAAGVPIVPVAISGSEKILSAGGFSVKPGSIKISVGDPIRPSEFGGMDAKSLARMAEDKVRILLAARYDGGAQAAA